MHRTVCVFMSFAANRFVIFWLYNLNICVYLAPAAPISKLQINTVTHLGGNWPGFQPGTVTINGIAETAHTSCYLSEDHLGRSWIIFNIARAIVTSVWAFFPSPPLTAGMEYSKVEVCDTGATNCEVCGFFPVPETAGIAGWGGVTCGTVLSGTEVRVTPPLLDQLEINDRMIALCEVEVYGLPTDAPKAMTSGKFHILNCYVLADLMVIVPIYDCKYVFVAHHVHNCVVLYVLIYFHTTYVCSMVYSC